MLIHQLTRPWKLILHLYEVTCPSLPKHKLHVKRSITPALFKEEITICFAGLLESTIMVSEWEPNKQRRYDLSMSRRTRKSPTTTSTIKNSRDEDEELQKKSKNGFHHVSLKELMEETNGEKIESRTGEGNGDGMKLMETAAGKNLPMVRKQGEGIEGVKMVGLLSRYAKVLNQLIKVKRSSKRKNVAQLLV